MHSETLICVEILSDPENSGLLRCRIRQVQWNLSNPTPYFHSVISSPIFGDQLESGTVLSAPATPAIINICSVASYPVTHATTTWLYAYSSAIRVS